MGTGLAGHWNGYRSSRTLEWVQVYQDIGMGTGLAGHWNGHRSSRTLEWVQV